MVIKMEKEKMMRLYERIVMLYVAQLRLANISI